MRKANVLLSSVVLASAMLAPTLTTTAAKACGVAYPAGSYARVAGERAVIVWDAATKREHFIRRPTFDGDAKDFGYFMPTPTVPDVSKESNALIDKVASLASPLVEGSGGAPGSALRGGSGAVAVLQTVNIDDFEIVTLKADSSDKLGEWLKAHAFVDRPSLRAWAAPYLAKGWVISAMRYVAPATATANARHDAGAAHERAPVETPTLRFSFGIDAPFYPYTEPQTDAKDEAAYLTRTGKQGLETRPLFVWLVASEPLEAFQGATLSGPYLHASHEVPTGAITTALGDTSKWGFKPSARTTWTVTYLNQFEDRVAKEDVNFRKAKVLLPPSAANAVTAPTSAPALHGVRAFLGSHKALAALGLLGLLLAVGLVLLRELYPAPKQS